MGVAGRCRHIRETGRGSLVGQPVQRTGERCSGWTREHRRALAIRLVADRTQDSDVFPIHCTGFSHPLLDGPSNVCPRSATFDWRRQRPRKSVVGQWFGRQRCEQLLGRWRSDCRMDQPTTDPMVGSGHGRPMPNSTSTMAHFSERRPRKGSLDRRRTKHLSLMRSTNPFQFQQTVLTAQLAVSIHFTTV